jgi:hypothetical protein
MPYATEEQIRARATRYLDRATSEQLAAGLEFGASKVNSRLSTSRYASLIPFAAPVPGIVTSIAADLAAYFVLDDLFQQGESTAPIEYARELYQRAMEELQAIVDGNADIPESEISSETLPKPSVAFRRGSCPTPLANFDGRNMPKHPLYRRGLL